MVLLYNNFSLFGKGDRRVFSEIFRDTLSAAHKVKQHLALGASHMEIRSCLCCHACAGDRDILRIKCSL